MNKAFLVFYITVIAIVAPSRGSVSGIFGICENFGINEIDVEKFFTGRWYNQRSYGTYLQLDGICPAFQFEVKNKTINTIYYQYESLAGSYVYFKGSAGVDSLLGNMITFSFDYFAGVAHLELPVTIVDTDYENYAIFYSCKGSLGLKYETSWIATRVRGDTMFDEKIKNIIIAKGLNYADYTMQKTTGCDATEPSMLFK